MNVSPNYQNLRLSSIHLIQLVVCIVNFAKKKHERQLIEKLKKSIENDLDIYDYPKYIEKLKNKKRKINIRLIDLKSSLIKIREKCQI